MISIQQWRYYIWSTLINWCDIAAGRMHSASHVNQLGVYYIDIQRGPKSEASAHFCFYLCNALTKSDISWHTSAAVYSKYSAANFTQFKCTTIGRHIEQELLWVWSALSWLQIKSCIRRRCCQSFWLIWDDHCMPGRLSVVPWASFFGWVSQGWLWIPLLWEFLHTTPSARRLFKSQCFYKNFILFRDFSVITASYFITTGISVTVKYILVSE